MQAISVILQKFRHFRKHAKAGKRHLFTLTSFANINIMVSVKKWSFDKVGIPVNIFYGPLAECYGNENYKKTKEPLL